MLRNLSETLRPPITFTRTEAAKSQTGTDSIFTREYFLKKNGYEQISAGPAIYLPSAIIQAEISKLANGDKPINRVLDGGSGTGNSTLTLAEVYNDNNILHIGPEPKEDALTIARYKYGRMSLKEWREFTRGIKTSRVVRDSIRAKKNLGRTYAGENPLVQGRLEGIPFDNSIDIVHCVQSLHWSNVPQSLKEIRITLKEGGLFVFDETGYQFDFSDLEVNGSRINSYHFLNHPFRTEFIKKINEIFKAEGLPEIDPKKIDEFHHMFDQEKLEIMLEETGFNLESIDYTSYEEVVNRTALRTNRILVPFDGDKYKGLISPRTKEDMEKFIVGGGPMRYFNSPLAKALPDEAKSRILKLAFKTAIKSHPELLDVPAAETLAFFVARAA